MSGFGLNFIEYLGIVGFSVSGYLVARQENLDIYGAIFLGLTTSTGGGVMRDVIIGAVPPVNWLSVLPLSLAIGSALVASIPFISKLLVYKNSNLALVVFDAAGLAAFSVSGAAASLAIHDSVSLALFSGVITATGGGMVRDVLAGRVPFVLRRELYATLSLGAAGLYVLLDGAGLSQPYTTGLPLSLAFFSRLIFRFFNLHLPQTGDRK